MVYKQPTYEEYCKATEFAKFRYKFGVYVQLVAALLLCLLFVYSVVNVEEMKSNPAEYAEKKLGVVCNPPMTIILEDYGDYRNIESVGEG